MNRVRQRCNHKSQPCSPLASGRFLDRSSGHLLTLLHKVTQRLEGLDWVAVGEFNLSYYIGDNAHIHLHCSGSGPLALTPCHSVNRVFIKDFLLRSSSSAGRLQHSKCVAHLATIVLQWQLWVLDTSILFHSSGLLLRNFL